MYKINKERIMELAGSWSDFEGFDKFLQDIYDNRINKLNRI